MKKFLVVGGVIALLSGSPGVANAEFNLTILHINDLHSRIEPINKYDSTCDQESEQEGKCFGGIARIKSLLDSRRSDLVSQGKEFVTLDAGDQFQGSLFYTTYKGDAAVEFMNEMDFDAMAVGNHEFDDGPAILAKFIDNAKFPVVSGNIDVSTDSDLKDKVLDTLILSRGGEQIGIVSALAEDTDETSSPGDDVKFIMSEDSLKDAVERLDAAGVNKIIALTHVGLPRDKQIASSVAGIDVIVGGHSHTLLSNTNEDAEGPYPVLVENPNGVMVPIVQAYAYGKYLGEIEIVFDDDGNVISATGEPIVIDSTIIPDEEFSARVMELNEPLEELKSRVIGSTEALINGDRSNCRAEECQMGNLVADAMLDKVKGQGIQIAIQNGGGLRASIDAGDVTMGEVLTVLPFQNTLSTFQLRGSDIVTALENGVSQVEDEAGRFPQVAGLKYSWTKSKPANEGRILDVEVSVNGNWQPIDPNHTYGVVSNNYMRSGGDGYSVLAENGINAYDYGPGLEQVVADYLAASLGYIPYLDGRIKEVQ